LKVEANEVELIVNALELLYVVGKVTGVSRENGDHALVLSEQIRKGGKMEPSRFHEERDSLDNLLKERLGAIWCEPCE